MRFDFMVNVWTHGRNVPYRDVIAEYVEQARAAEQAGFTGIWSGEHHFQEEGFDLLPNPVLLGSHLAAHTTSIRIGLGALTLPSWNPVRAAEDVASLDHFSNGRVDCAFSRGIDPRDIVHLNPAADRSDEKRSLGLFEEALDVVTRSWTAPVLAYEGDHFRYPQPDLKVRPMPWHRREPRFVNSDGVQIGLDVLPKPLQSPHPPLHVVSESPSGVRLAAGRDMNVITWLPSGGRLTSLLTTYAEALSAAGDVHAVGDRAGLLRPCFVAPTMEEARARTAEAVARMAGAMTGGPRGRAAFATGPDDVDEQADIFDYLLARDHLLIGTPDSVTEQIARLRDSFGIRHILCWMPFYGVEHADVLRSIDLFAGEVAGRFTEPAETARG
jgi:alkanesulfonate monooxygenase SsuD/methylene tetrahydromethanopterin reductase-like flavin-dependent oxidoreductase (luciferase family)